MPKRKGKSQAADAVGTVLAFAEVVDALFMRYTGKTIPAWLKESQERPRELPPGKEPLEKEIASSDPAMPLDLAYSVLGLKLDASPDDVKKNYRNLARAFHSDRGSAMNDEAMKLLNRAFDTIRRHKEGSDATKAK